MTDARVLQTLWTYGNVGLAYVGLGGVIRDINPAFSRLVGYTSAELVGEHFKTITHPADIDADVEMVRRVVNKETAQYEMIKSYIHKDGRSVLVKMMVFPIITEEDEVEFLLAEVTEASPTFLAPSMVPPDLRQRTPSFLVEHKEVILKLLGALGGLIAAATLLLQKQSEIL